MYFRTFIEGGKHVKEINEFTCYILGHHSSTISSGGTRGKRSQVRKPRGGGSRDYREHEGWSSYIVSTILQCGVNVMYSKENDSLRSNYFIRLYNPFGCTVPSETLVSVGGRQLPPEVGCRSFFDPGSQDIDVSLVKTVVGLSRIFI